MAVKASAQITLSYIVDVKATYRYYLLQSSTAATPAKPTTYPPSSSWNDTEPSYTEGSTNSLYFVDCTIFNDDNFTYSEVSVSSSYEAAKLAYNKASNAETTANSANDKIDNLEVGGRNLLLNSSFTEGFDEWGNSGAEITEIDGVTCAHITGALATTYQVNQNVLAKIDTTDLTQTYVYSADVRMDSFVAGTTNPYVKLYFSGSYDNDGTSAWMGATTVSGTPECNAYNNQGWVRMVWVVKFNRTPINMTIYMYARDFTGDLYFKNLKLEKGNKATDWTPAPEDVNEQINDAQDTANDANQTATNNSSRLDQAEATIEQLVDRIQMIVTDSEGTSLWEQTSEGWSFDITNITDRLQKAEDTLTSVQNDVGNLDEEETVEKLLDNLQELMTDVQNRTAYIDMKTDENGDPYLELGRREDSEGFKVAITNSTITFKLGSLTPIRLENRDGVGYVIADKLTVEDEFQQGGFVWKVRSNGNLGLIWRGVTS